MAHRFCISRKGGTGGGGWGHPQDDMHMAAARLGCTNRPRKCYYHLLGGSFLAGKAAWALSGYLPTEDAAN